MSAAHRTGSTDYVSSAVRPCCEHECAPGPVAGRAQAETPHLPSTECLSQASRASTRLSAARRASTTVSTPLLSAPCCAPVRAGGCRGLWRAVRRLKHPTCLVRNVYHRLPGPAPACPPPAGQAPQFPHLSRAPLLCAWMFGAKIFRGTKVPVPCGQSTGNLQYLLAKRTSRSPSTTHRAAPW